MTFTMKILSPVLAAAGLVIALAAPAAASFPGPTDVDDIFHGVGTPCVVKGSARKA